MSQPASTPYVDPEIAEILREAAANPLPDPTRLPLADARAQITAVNAPWNEPAVPLAWVRDFTIQGPGGELILRHYRPSEAEHLPVVVYMHGGGWTFCSLDTHDRLMRLLAQETGAAVLGVDYRLAPEHPFPAALEDCMAAIAWLRADGEAAGLDPARMVVAGDSAGANLALACLLQLRHQGPPQARGGALFYGCYWARFDTHSHLQFGRDDTYQLPSARIRWFWNNYLGVDGVADPLAEPLLATLSGLPPLFLNAGALDPVADDTRELASRLREAGVAHEVVIHPGLIHAFMRMTSRCAAAREALATAADAIRRMLD